jgi:hypothetical protein
MKQVPFLHSVVLSACAVMAVPSLLGQNSTNPIKLFDPVEIRVSAPGTGYPPNEDIFNTSTVQLNCNASVPVHAVLASTADGTGNVLVDNYVNLTVTAGGSTTGPVNVCQGGFSEGGLFINCFTNGYRFPALDGQLTGQDPDNITSSGGVPPIDISSFLRPGSQQLKIDLVDTGDLLISSSLYLKTTCSETGGGPALADLFLRIKPTPEAVHQGDLLTYAFPVWNTGSGNGDHEVLITRVPEGTTFDYVRVSGTPGLGTCTTPTYGGVGQIICHENSVMAPNTTWTVRLTVKVAAPPGTVITENATTLADTTDPNLANNTATVSTTVQ